MYKIILDSVLQGLITFYNDTSKGAVFIEGFEFSPHNRSSKSAKYYIGPSLYAIAAKYSFAYSEEGYIFLEAKINLIEYYMRSQGAIMTMVTEGYGDFSRPFCRIDR